MDEKQLYVVKTVAQDLIYLKDEWDKSIKDDSLRRNSNVTRMLLADRKYGEAWRNIGFEKEPKILAPNLNATLVGIPCERIKFAQAGGALFNGMTIESVLLADIEMTPKRIKDLYEARTKIQKEAYGLSKFMESPCMIIEKTTINRRELILYISNKLGGTHIDTSRNPKNDIEKKFLLMDSINVLTAEKNALFYELLSIGQSVVKSRDTDKFLKRVREKGLI